jgi:hypothetical protein
MRTFFLFSLIALAGLVLWELRALLELLRGTLWLKDFYARATADPGIPARSPAPAFTAEVIGGGRLFDSGERLRGHSSILLFVATEVADSPYYAHLDSAMHAFWHKADGHLYVLCSGTRGDCERVARTHQLQQLAHGPVVVLHDPDAAIARRYRIARTPQAVLIDEEGMVARYGKPSPRRVMPQHDLLDEEASPPERARTSEAHGHL